MISDCPLEGRSISSQSHEPRKRAAGRGREGGREGGRPTTGFPHDQLMDTTAPVSRAEGSRPGLAATCPRNPRDCEKPERPAVTRRSARTSGRPARHGTRGPGRWSTRQGGGPGGLAAARPQAPGSPRGSEKPERPVAPRPRGARRGHLVDPRATRPGGRVAGRPGRAAAPAASPLLVRRVAGALEPPRRPSAPRSRAARRSALGADIWSTRAPRDPGAESGPGRWSTRQGGGPGGLAAARPQPPGSPEGLREARAPRGPAALGADIWSTRAPRAGDQVRAGQLVDPSARPGRARRGTRARPPAAAPSLSRPTHASAAGRTTRRDAGRPAPRTEREGGAGRGSARATHRPARRPRRHAAPSRRGGRRTAAAPGGVRAASAPPRPPGPRRPLGKGPRGRPPAAHRSAAPAALPFPRPSPGRGPGGGRRGRGAVPRRGRAGGAPCPRLPLGLRRPPVGGGRRGRAGEGGRGRTDRPTERRTDETNPCVEG